MTKKQERFRFTDTEMEIVKGTDLPDLLTHLGYQVRRVGSYYTTKEMDSLRIKERRLWKRYSNQTGGDAIAFLQEFCGKDFREAVNYLLEFNNHRARDSPSPQSRIVPEKEHSTFALPSANSDQRRVFAYLRKRGIAAQVIQGFIQAGLLYEDTEHHNCVFVGRDIGGNAVFANKRGTYDLGGSGFKGDAAGSNKDIAFRLPCDPKLDHVAVFEAPIDLMSFCTMYRQVRSNAVALCCLYQGPLDTYLRENPHLKRIILCLDADKWGREAAKKLQAEYTQKGYTVSIKTPAQGKDWNEYLQWRSKGQEDREQHQNSAR
nr:toprim domain-containing protein [uncultured Flavonifractor sp.]